MVTGVDDPDVVEKALELGAYGYIVKPFKVSEVIINISSVLRRQRLEAENRIYQKNLEKMVADRTLKLHSALNGVIQAIGRTVESRDSYTAGHQRRSAELARSIARKLGLAEDRVEGIHMAGMIHDLGKLSVPAEILSKPAQLTGIEFDLIKAHPKVGYNILKEIDFPWPLAIVILQHHERINGSGYPNGLRGEETLLEARILAVADVVEAMASHRPYRPAVGIQKALEEISNNKGLLYDPEAVMACLKLFYEDQFRFSNE
ncbi:MAG: HD domain-containing protein [Deltaproteobacteria bacterium]|nr:HD domain-containing protein [Deltaproteobacteria bacterium]